MKLNFKLELEREIRDHINTVLTKYINETGMIPRTVVLNFKELDVPPFIVVNQVIIK